MPHKLLQVLVFATFFAVIICFPKMTIAAPAIFDVNSTAIIAQSNGTLSNIDLTPQFRQQLQGVRQRRNLEIQKVLSVSQIEQLRQNLRAGERLTQALDKLQLKSDQQEMINAIMKISDLKTKTILSRYSFYGE